jgi:hypothetical protein
MCACILYCRSIAPHGYAACAVGEAGGLHPELGESFQPPSNSRFTRCSGDATYVPLLNLVGDGPDAKIVNVTGGEKHDINEHALVVSQCL